MSGVRLSRVLTVSCIALFLFGVFFRAVLYSRIYIAPGDPYGLSDIIEFALGWLLIGLLAASVIASLFLAVKGPRQTRIAAAWLVVVVAVVVVLLEPLHTLAARWSS